MASPGALRFRGSPRGPMFANRTPGGNLVSGRVGGVSFRIQLHGAAELSRKLGQMAQNMADEKMAQAVLAGGEVLAEEWRRLVPKFERHYERSITAVSSPGKQGATGLVYPADVPGLEDSQQPRRYAARLEFGSLAQTKKMLKRGMPADPGRARRMQPSLRPAFDAKHAEMVDAIADQLRQLLP